MSMKYFIYTVVAGYTFVICNNSEGGFVVLSNPSDDIVLQIDEETANKIAKDNSNATVTYKIKPVP